MKRLIATMTLTMSPILAHAQVTVLVCTYKGLNVPLSINYNTNTVTNMYNEVNPATITDKYIEFIDGKNTRVAINRATGQMILNNHNDKPLVCKEIKPSV